MVHPLCVMHANSMADSYYFNSETVEKVDYYQTLDP